MTKRRIFAATIKAKVALQALRSDKKIREIHPDLMPTRKHLAVEAITDVFTRGGKSERLNRPEFI